MGEQPSHKSLPEVHGTVPIPATAGFWRKLLAFAGPGYLVAVGYMDPGNWATDLAGGARFGYTLLSVVMLSNLMAILLQALAARLGIATGRDLAQACRDHYSRPVAIVLWVLCRDRHRRVRPGRGHRLGHRAQPAVRPAAACWASCLTALDVLIVLYLQQHRLPLPRGARGRCSSSAIAGCFAIELFCSQPDVGGGRSRASCRRPEILRNPRHALHRRSASSARR